MAKKKQELDELLDRLTLFLYELYEKYDMEERDIAFLIDGMKEYAALYGKLLKAGKISPEKQLKKDPKQAIDLINKELGIEI